MAKPHKDTYSYKGWLNSDVFLKRAFASLGYQFVAGVIIHAGILIVALIALLLAFILSPSSY